MRMIKPLGRLYEQLRRLPGVGSKTALRLAYHIVDMTEDEVISLANALLQAKKDIVVCKKCFNLSSEAFCEVCSMSNRDKKTVCVVEQPQDIAALEKSRTFNGLYHVLHGVLSPLDGIGPERLKIKELIGRVGEDDIKEVIIATNSDVEGEATAVYIARLIKPLGVEVSRIAQGIPIGGDIEYADELTLSRALENRRSM